MTLNAGGLLGAAIGAAIVLAIWATVGGKALEKRGHKVVIYAIIGGAFAGNFVWQRLVPAKSIDVEKSMAHARAGSPQLHQLLVETIRSALDSIDDSSGTFAGLFLAETETNRAIKNFRVNSIEQSEAMAKRCLEQVDRSIIRCSVAWPGVMAIKGETSNVIFVEGCERGSFLTYVFAQPFVIDAQSEKPVLRQEAVFVENRRAAFE